MRAVVFSTFLRKPATTNGEIKNAQIFITPPPRRSREIVSQITTLTFDRGPPSEQQEGYRSERVVCNRERKDLPRTRDMDPSINFFLLLATSANVWFVLKVKERKCFSKGYLFLLHLTGINYSHVIIQFVHQ